MQTRQGTREGCVQSWVLLLWGAHLWGWIRWWAKRCRQSHGWGQRSLGLMSRGERCQVTAESLGWRQAFRWQTQPGGLELRGEGHWRMAGEWLVRR